MNPNKLFTVILFMIFIVSQMSCMNYYKISKSTENTSPPSATIHTNINRQRYFILRNGNKAYHMNNIVDFKDSLTCTLETLPDEHRLHLKKSRGGHMRFKKYKPEAVVLNEAHIYEKSDDDAKAGENYTLMYNRIERIEVLEKNKQRTTTSYILGGTIIAAPFIFMIIAIAKGGYY